MTDGGEQPGPDGETIGELIARLVEDGRTYAEAEIAVAKAIVAYRATRARRALVALAIGWFLLFAAMTAVVIGAMVALAQQIGPLFAAFIVGLPLAIGGYLLAHYGWDGIKGLGRDEGERDAIERGETPP
ncbi:MAG: phage holin family protein [Sphingomonas sp.]|nr:phage holin family protein [Sphingomonas sp.]